MSDYNRSDIPEGGVSTAKSVNDELSKIETVLNGNIDNGNIKANAGIANSKLASPASFLVFSATIETLDGGGGGASEHRYLMLPPAEVKPVRVVAGVDTTTDDITVQLQNQSGNTDYLTNGITLTTDDDVDKDDSFTVSSFSADTVLRFRASIAANQTANGITLHFICKAKHVGY